MPSPSTSNILSHLHTYRHLKCLMMLSKVSFYKTISSNTDRGKERGEKNLCSVRLQFDPDSTSNIQSSFTKAEGMHTLNQNIR